MIGVGGQEGMTRGTRGHDYDEGPRGGGGGCKEGEGHGEARREAGQQEGDAEGVFVAGKAGEVACDDDDAHTRQT